MEIWTTAKLVYAVTEPVLHATSQQTGDFCLVSDAVSSIIGLAIVISSQVLDSAQSDDVHGATHRFTETFAMVMGSYEDKTVYDPVQLVGLKRRLHPL
jgi:hypothetical protein